MMHSKHAYLIMKHADEYLLQVLISMLDDKRNDLYIHADSKWVNFAQTILWQDYFAPKGIPMSDCWDDLRFVNWQDTPHSPDIFRMKDFSEIRKSRKLFARKFSSTVDRSIIDLIQFTFTSNAKNESNSIQNS